MIKTVSVILALTIFLSAAPIVPAHEESVVQANEFIQENRDFFESQAVQALFGDERMNFTIARVDGSTARFGVVTQNGTVIDIHAPEIENPTVNITTTERALLNIKSAYFDPQEEFDKQLRSGEIRYEPVGIVSTIKFGGLGILNGIFTFFKNVFSPPEVRDTCFSDDGDNPGERGFAIKGTTSFYDTCENPSTLKEYYCSSGSVSLKNYDCDCSEGACTQ